jgi:hypothetical protein
VSSNALYNIIFVHREKNLKQVFYSIIKIYERLKNCLHLCRALPDRDCELEYVIVGLRDQTALGLEVAATEVVEVVHGLFKLGDDLLILERDHVAGSPEVQ